MGMLQVPLYGMPQPMHFQAPQVPPFQVMPPGFQGMPMQMAPYAVQTANGGGEMRSAGSAPAPKEDTTDGGESGPKAYAEVGYGDIFKQFVLLGWTAFGGPAAHIALFQVSARLPGTLSSLGSRRADVPAAENILGGCSQLDVVLAFHGALCLG